MEKIGKPKSIFGLIIIAAVAAVVIFNWIWFAGPNHDTLLTYHRNHIANSFIDMFRILAGQDQAPFPQLLHYTLHRLGFSGIVSLQAINSTIVVAVLIWVLAMDLNTSPRYQELTIGWRTIVYVLGAVAMIVTSSFSASLTWVRYAATLGVAWYGIWMLEERLLAANNLHTRQRLAIALGAVLGFGLLISYTWGVVIVASILSISWRRQIRQPGILSGMLLGAIPGMIATTMWLAYAGSHHLSLILLRTHGASGQVIKIIGKGVHLLAYPFMGLLLFPGLVSLLTLIASVGTIGLAVVLFLRARRELIVPFFCHMLIPIPLYLLTAVTSGYGMIGPGLIILSCAIKGMLQLPSRRAALLTAIGFAALTWGMIANLQGMDAASPLYHANKSRVAVNKVLSHLVEEQALNDRTMIVASDESSRFLIESLAAVRHRFLIETAPRTAPNIDALLRFGYHEDVLTSEIDRVIVIFSDNGNKEESNYVNKWLQDEKFKKSSFHCEIAPYSKWLNKTTSTTSTAQYVIEEWMR